MRLVIEQAAPGLTVQDMGRPGWIARGLSRGGAMDRLALAEGAALLRRPVGAALEMAGMGGRFTCDHDLAFALTGAPMRAKLDGARLVWNASHILPQGSVLEIGPAERGVYGYLTFGADLDLPPLLGAQSAHLTARLGSALSAGDVLPLIPKPAEANLCLPFEDRFDGGLLRVIAGMQTPLFSPETRARLESEPLTRDPRGNRQGLRLVPGGAGFAAKDGQSILSEVISVGDIQIPGDGAPYILMAESQTTGGYPRIGTVIPADLPRAAQTPPGACLRFCFVARDDALEAERRYRAHLAALPDMVQPLVRDPKDIRDLLAYRLIDGAITGYEED